MVSLAHTDVASLRARYVDDLRAAPALAEPFVIFAPATLQDGDSMAFLDVHGERLALTATDAGNDGTTQILRGLSEAGLLACVLGRLVDGDAGMALCPLSAVVRQGEAHMLRRLT